MACADTLHRDLDQMSTNVIWGRVASLSGGIARIDGLGGLACAGDSLVIDRARGEPLRAEAIALEGRYVVAMTLGRADGAAVGDRVRLAQPVPARPGPGWLGCVLDAFGRRVDGTLPEGGLDEADLFASPPPAALRRALGDRLSSGMCAFDTLLPLCRGQRLGLFAGSGVGKSSLLGRLARGVDADVVVVGLIGERGREVRAVVEEAIGPDALDRCVVIVATSDEPAPVKLRAARMALAAAERFRDDGLNVLLLMDSLTRFAEAHREVALAAGETPSLRAYPPSTGAELARLVERAGPGVGAAGDITAVFSVLVAGSDMDEPVADMVRGLLDGHVVLSRDIAERGRFPAIDAARSVSRSLPKAASGDENAVISETRSLIGKYEQIEPMVQAGLYAKGADPLADRAIELYPAIDKFLAEEADGPRGAFARLAGILGRDLARVGEDQADLGARSES